MCTSIGPLILLDGSVRYCQVFRQTIRARTGSIGLARTGSIGLALSLATWPETEDDAHDEDKLLRLHDHWWNELAQLGTSRKQRALMVENIHGIISP